MRMIGHHGGSPLVEWNGGALRELSVDDVLDVLEGLFELKLGRRQLLARLKHMHRLDFPAGHATGRGYRSTYDAGKLIQIGLAFALIDVGLAPSHAVAIISTNWFVIGAGIAIVLPGAECQLAMGARALSDMGSRPGAKKGSAPVAVLVHENSPSLADRERLASVVIELGSFMRQLEHYLLRQPSLDAYDWRLAVAQGLPPAE